MARSYKKRSQKKKSSKKRSYKKKSRSHKRSHKKSRPHSYVRTSKRLTKKYQESCSGKKKQYCLGDPNCSWSSSRRHCYRGKQAVYAGPSLE